MNEKVTIYDIAKKLNITAATVSRALNNNPKISESTRKLVMETAAAMNYKQNKLAVALKSGKSNTVGVIVPYIDRNFFASIIRGIEEELDPMGYHTIICQTHEDEQKEKDTINALLNTQIDGILMSITKVTQSTSHFRNVLNKQIPLIFFDRKKNIPGVSTVTINDFDGGYQATKHLIEQGCKRIAHTSGDFALEIYKDRFEGYKEALSEYGIPFKKEYVMQTRSDTDAGKDAITKFMKLPNPPDALFSSSDYVALGAIQKLKELGVNIPEDFSVVGFSNEPFTKFMELSISSVDQNPMEMGKMAARVFLEQMNDSGVKIEKKVILSPSLMIRKSSTKND
ncbi:LacI family DNA-binding transcriptional regulator [Robertkochia solimangrovi]|uniref:LacI family DNA-binding transcriptional regulator n=1 Tax=Robertkochia solimangrovi TaxID=2213046 RepID=UPI00117CB71A|nr:LacI family DNA-binding transcriptional regulator [Robertkochia solimangrovi]TRZ46207.1 LacI family transcriptional regulator [Robertkochia solimangrovi]